MTEEHKKLGRMESEGDNTRLPASTQILAVLPKTKEYGYLLRRVGSLQNYIPQKKKPVQSQTQLPLETEDESEASIEASTKILLQKVDILVNVMEKMSKGPIGVDNYRYDAINDGLQEMKKNISKKISAEEELNNFQLKNVNKKLQAIEFELRDIYVSWLQYYSVTLQEVFKQCLTLYKQVDKLKKKSKRQISFLHAIREFSSYAAAQKSSLLKLIHESYIELPEMFTVQEISERIDNLETMLNTPFPISLGNVPRLSASTGEKKKKKKKSTNENKKNKKLLEMEAMLQKKEHAREKTRIQFEEPGTSEQSKKNKEEKEHEEKVKPKSNAGKKK